MEKEHLTTAFIKKLDPAKRERFADTEVPGLQVRGMGGSVSFYLRKRSGTKIHERLIGKFPDITLEEARAKALRMLGSLSNFHRLDAPSSRTLPLLGETIDAFCNSFSNKKTRENYISYLAVFAPYRDRKIVDLKKSEIQDLHKSMKDKPVMANHAIKALATAISRMYDFLGISDYVNPARDIPLYREHARKRFMDNNEAPAIIRALEELAGNYRNSVQAYAILMMIYTGQRKMNVLSMDYSEIWNGETWTIPAEKAKGKNDITVPLNDYAKEILHKLCGSEKLPSSGPVFLFRGHQMKEVRKTMATACRMCGITDLHVHDLRRSLGSWMLMNGVDIAVVSRTLGHKSIAVTEQVYAHMLPGKISSATQSAIKAMRNGKA